jgi:hypothetical protein
MKELDHRYRSLWFFFARSVGTGTSVGILPVRPAVYFSIFSVKEYAV